MRVSKHKVGGDWTDKLAGRVDVVDTQARWEGVDDCSFLVFGVAGGPVGHGSDEERVNIFLCDGRG